MGVHAMGDISTHNLVHGIERRKERILTWACALKTWHQMTM